MSDFADFHRRVRQGDWAAASETEWYQSQIRLLVIVAMGSYYRPHDADDLCQEVWLLMNKAAPGKLAKYRGTSETGSAGGCAWWKNFIRWRVLDAFRQLCRENSRTVPLGDDANHIACKPASDRFLDAAEAMMPRQYELFCRLRDGDSVKEFAERKKMCTSTAYKLRKHLRNTIRRQFM